MAELRSQGVEVAGEDYIKNEQEKIRDVVKQTVAERLDDLVDDIFRDDDYMRSAHGRLCSKSEVWQWIADIARMERKSHGCR